MAEVICKVTPGLRQAEATVTVHDIEGNPEVLPVDRDFLSREGDNYFLPVHVIHVDDRRKASLVSLPVEADSGANRIWVKTSDLRHPETTP
jgi:hypothetical protein